MTYQASSNKLFLSELKQRLWAIILMFIAFLLVGPFSLLMSIENYEMYNNSSEIPRQICDYLNYSFLGDGKNALIAGCAMAFICFGFLYSKSAVDFYHSLPIKREKIFLYKMITGAGIGTLIIIGCSALSYAVIGCKGYLTAMVSRYLLFTSSKMLVCFLLAFAICTIAIMLTGTVVTGILGSAVLMFASAFAGWIGDAYMSLCFSTYYSRGDITVLSAIINPLKIMDANPTQANLPAIIVSLVFEALVLLFAGFALYMKRPSESVAKSIAFNIAKPIIRIPLVILAALSGGIYVSYLASNLTEYWYWIVFFVVGLLAHVGLEAIMEQDIKGVYRHPVQFVICMAVAVFISLSMQYDWIGYDLYIPEENQIASASVRLFNIEGDTGRYELDEYGNWTYSNSDDFFEKVTCDKEAALGLAKAGIEALDKKESAIKMRINQLSEEYTYIPENYYTICYHLKSGRNVYRQYRTDIAKIYEECGKVYEDKSYKSYIYQISEYADSDAVSNFHGINMYQDEAFGSQTIDTKLFMDKYVEDLMDRTIDDIKDYPIFVLSGYNPMNGVDLLGMYYIYEADTRTIEYLKSAGVDIEKNRFNIKPESIVSIKVNDYTGEGFDEGACEYTHEDGADKISELAQVLIPSNVCYINEVLHPIENGIELVVLYEDENGREHEIYCSVPKGTVVY